MTIQVAIPSLLTLQVIAIGD